METTFLPEMSVYEMMWNAVRPLYSLYILFGFLAVICNIFASFVYLSSKTLRRRCKLIIVLCIADFVNGLAFLLSGINRLYDVTKTKDVYDIKEMYIERKLCAKKIQNIVMIIGNQWPAVVILCIGIERVVAVTLPTRFTDIKRKTTPFVISFTFLFCLISVTLGIYFGTIVDGTTKVFFACTVNSSYGEVFGLTLAISILSVLLVALPNVLLYIRKYAKVDNRILGYVYCLFCLRSSLNFAVNVLFNRDFYTQIKTEARKKLPPAQRRTEKRMAGVQLVDKRSNAWLRGVTKLKDVTETETSPKQYVTC
ncbi:hypothetical protein L596_013301 [Steinernema carpocapsae]|uniref:G-protein coupled receptors family 1 profile domain-containing protein n=1 Tax=Steinernema carpocapsae TaxID=34508 RepID=A0A4U5NZQ6_STECR|nr:hypothetical protein L596_013301 [Steinernema carpocapsae]